MSDMQSDKLRFICAIKYQYSQRPGTLSNIQNSACHIHVTLVGPCSSAAGPFLLAVAPAAVMCHNILSSSLLHLKISFFLTDPLCSTTHINTYMYEIQT